MRGYTDAGIPDQIRAAGGEIYGITSEPQTFASEAREAWDTGFDCIGDPHHEIVDDCRRRGWLDLFVNRRMDLFKQNTAEWAQHPNGFLQPGVLALSKSGRVLYRWRSRLTRSNAGGATHRPHHDHVWAAIQRALAERDDTPDAAPDHPPLDDGPTPWPLFVFLLLANGNFLRPKTFPLERGGTETPYERRIPRAIAKALVFLLAWACAFALLPPLPLVLALVVWLGTLTPALVRTHREFQNEPSGR